MQESLSVDFSIQIFALQEKKSSDATVYGVEKEERREKYPKLNSATFSRLHSKKTFDAHMRRFQLLVILKLSKSVLISSETFLKHELPSIDFAQMLQNHFLDVWNLWGEGRSKIRTALMCNLEYNF